MGVEALNCYVTARPVVGKDTDGIKTSQYARKENRWHEITSVGPGVPDWNGKVLPLPVKPGQVTYMTAHGTEKVSLPSVFEEPEVRCAHIGDLLCLLSDGLEIQPLGSLVEVQKVKASATYGSGILLPDNKKDPPCIGLVKGVGAGWVGPSSEPVPMQVSTGMYVYFLPHRTYEIDFEVFGSRAKRYLVQHGDILAKLSSLSEEQQDWLQANLEPSSHEG